MVLKNLCRDVVTNFVKFVFSNRACGVDSLMYIKEDLIIPQVRYILLNIEQYYCISKKLYKVTSFLTHCTKLHSCI